MPAPTTTDRRPVNTGNANRDRSGWKDDLRLIQSGLENLARHTQRDHYHHAVLYSAGPLPDAVPRGPRLYASGHRVARRIDVPLPGGGHLAHFFFDHNLDAAEDYVLSGLRRELGRVRSVLRAMPRGLVPEFDGTTLDGGPDGHLVAWLSLLHWLAHRRPNRVFTAHLEYLPSADQMAAGELFSPWDDHPAAVDLDPVPFLTGTKPAADGGVATCPPGVVASSLSKPLLYASVNAIELLLGPPAANPGSRPAPLRSVNGKLGERAMRVLNLLQCHHTRPDETECFEPLTVERIRNDTGYSQPTVSRAISDLFGPGTRAMTRYRQLCRQGKIHAELSRLLGENQDPKNHRVIYTAYMDRFADR